MIPPDHERVLDADEPQKPGLPVLVRRRPITVSEAARRWNVSRTTARKWLARGRLPDLAEPVEVPAEIPDVPCSGFTGTPKWNPMRIAGGIVLAAVAVAVAWFGVRINVWYGISLGKTAEASALLAGLSVSADVLALVLPAAAAALWRDGRHALASTAWSLWGTTVAIALLASVGFASVNIADTTAVRARVADQGAGLAERVTRLRAERAAILEARAVAAIEAEVQRAQPRVPADTWRDTKRCTDVTLLESGQACDPVLRLRQALETARRRDALDHELAEAEAKLSILPAVTAEDPQAETAAKLVAWASAGSIRISPADIHMARIAGMTLLPQLAGLVLMLALAVGLPKAVRP